MMRYFLYLICGFFPIASIAMDDLTTSQRISSAGMRAQNERLKIISQNIANANSTGSTPNSEPYRRKMPLLRESFDPVLKAKVVKLEKIVKDKTDFELRYEPHHPAADNAGYVKYPNVNLPLETVDAKEAQRTYEANISALEIAKSNQMRIIEALK